MKDFLRRWLGIDQIKATIHDELNHPAWELMKAEYSKTQGELRKIIDKTIAACDTKFDTSLDLATVGNIYFRTITAERNSVTVCFTKTYAEDPGDVFTVTVKHDGKESTYNDDQEELFELAEYLCQHRTGKGPRCKREK